MGCTSPSAFSGRDNRDRVFAPAKSGLTLRILGHCYSNSWERYWCWAELHSLHLNFNCFLIPAYITYIHILVVASASLTSPLIIAPACRQVRMLQSLHASDSEAMASHDTGTLTISRMNVAQHDILRLTTPESAAMTSLNAMDPFDHDLNFDADLLYVLSSLRCVAYGEECGVDLVVV